MAAALCSICGEEPEVAFVILGDNPGISYGAACFARLGLEAAKTVLPAEEIAESLGPMFVNGGGAVPAAAKRAPRSRKGKGAPAEPERASEPAPEGLEETPATAENG